MGRRGELTERALTTAHTVTTTFPYPDGHVEFVTWKDQWIRFDEAGLFRAMVAEKRLVDGVIPPVPEMMDRARRRLTQGPTISAAEPLGLDG